jgi:CRISPR-associated endonuclease/helicase Cas3
MLSKPGPHLVILNTVQSAAVIAHELRETGHETLHLSTALTPVDRNVIIDKVHQKLKCKDLTNWTLIATSCVEAGIDFSFKTAFRESSSVTSLIQVGGRANRHGYEEESSIIDFRVRDPLLNEHPAFRESRKIVDRMFDEGLMNDLSPTDLATESIRLEMKKTDTLKKAQQIRHEEEKQNYKEVACLCRVIEADTQIVVVNPSVVQRLSSYEKVSPMELLQNSVQIWSTKIAKLDLAPIKNHEELFSLGGYKYDREFLGYMAGLLPIVYQDEECLII